uniref:Uncharacterized protein n=1 Tax=virus sp. ctBM815 TaxID=2825806 RepID=A0A8S5RK13_9VIRU|nr:MAG TPA: hypothetical protein [virus sp. ctBM815]
MICIQLLMTLLLLRLLQLPLTKRLQELRQQKQRIRLRSQQRQLELRKLRVTMLSLFRMKSLEPQLQKLLSMKLLAQKLSVLRVRKHIFRTL